jgi:hypothetical protein
MRIGLIDVDGHLDFPNIALMKISAWHKSQGDAVEWFFPMSHYDKVYMSKIFDNSPDYETCINADVVIRGGRAYDKKIKLPPEIENTYPDYELYKIKDVAYGYLTRGCPWGCDFCDVQNIEGKVSYKVADLNQFWKGQKEIKLLDPNTLAYNGHMELLEQLANSGAWVDFTQGIDAWLLNLENVEMLSKIKVEMIHFAWDRVEDTTPYMLWHFKKRTNMEYQKLKVYVLTNFDTTEEQDLYRIYKLKELGYDPYVMIFNKSEFVTDKHRLKPIKELLKKFNTEQIEHFKKVWQLQRWVNNKRIFRSGQAETFEDYLIGV